jgi:hypothetical protein
MKEQGKVPEGCIQMLNKLSAAMKFTVPIVICFTLTACSPVAQKQIRS